MTTDLQCTPSNDDLHAVDHEGEEKLEAARIANFCQDFFQDHLPLVTVTCWECTPVETEQNLTSLSLSLSLSLSSLHQSKGIRVKFIHVQITSTTFLHVGPKTQHFREASSVSNVRFRTPQHTCCVVENQKSCGTQVCWEVWKHSVISVKGVSHGLLCQVHVSFRSNFCSRWQCSVRKDPHALRPVSQQSLKRCP